MSEFYRHPNAIVESTRVGNGTRIWAFAHVLPGAVVGDDCNICDHVFIENDVVVGNRVTIKCGVQLWDGVTIEDDVFVGPNATFTNDPFPRSRQHLSKYPETIVRKGASIGANATILPGVTIGQNAMVGAGAVVTRSVPSYAVVVGSPARIVRYADAEVSGRPPRGAVSPSGGPDIRVDRVQLIDSPVIGDLRGNLLAREVGKGLLFAPARYFVVFDVPSKDVRGEHAHRVCEQFLVCLRGSVAVVCDDGEHRQEFLLESPETGLYLPPMVWGTQYKYSRDAMLLVLASHAYDPGDYIRDYDQFLAERGAMRSR
ncbi:MAG: WxcM-like domain-containing protein [Thermoanaerobaculia bacterium]|jgi:acetyltransferase-like isoleucine patch superfamily enzyme